MKLHPFNGGRASDFWTARGTPAIAAVRLAGGDKHSAGTVRLAGGDKRSAGTPAQFPLLPDSPSNLTLEAELESEYRQNVPSIALLEAALFLAKEPMSSQRLAQLAGLPKGTRTQQLIRELNKQYDRYQSAFCIVEVAEGFQLRTRPEFASWLVRMQGVPTAVRLSNPAMETLTVIAYRQPIPRAEVERIRGVQCGDLIRQLLDQGLAEIVGRSEELGRPFLYGTTPQFLKVFGLASLDDLPALVSELPS